MANQSQQGAYGSGLPQGNYAQLMQALVSNPQAFTGGGFGQTLAANPQGGLSPQATALAANWYPGMPAQQAAPGASFNWGQQYPAPQQQWPAGYSSSPIGQAIMGMSPQASALAGWQAQAPPQQAIGNPIQALLDQQAAAQAAAAQQAAAQPAAPPPPPDGNVSGSGSE